MPAKTTDKTTANKTTDKTEATMPTTTANKTTTRRKSTTAKTAKADTVSTTVVWTRTAKGEEETRDVMDAPVIQPEEMRSANNAKEQIVANIMAGTLSEQFKQAVEKKTLSKMMPGDGASADRNAIKVLAGIPAETIRQKWAAHEQEMKRDGKRVTAPSLSRLKKLVSAAPSEKDKDKLTPKQILAEMATARDNGDTGRIDALLCDWMIDNGYIVDPAEPSH